jgi:hypothetical protein
MTRYRAVCAAALTFLPFLAVVFFACGGPAFTTAPGGEDGSAPDGAMTTDSGSDANRDSALPPLDASSVPHVVFVSVSTGSDLNSGLSQASPKKTLVSGIAAAAAIDGGAEVRACAGTYQESNLSLSAAVSLRGSFDCSTWTRTATFGYPTFDQTNATIVQNGSPASQPQTLVIDESVPSTSTVDGLVIQGAPVLDGTTTGVTIRDSASPLVTDDVITGGGGHPTSGTGSIGLTILDAAGPQVEHCLINGGTGTGPLGSTGVEIDSTGTPNVHDNTISGGLGTSTGNDGTHGMLIQSSVAGANALANNIVSACDDAGVSAQTSAIRIAAVDASAALAVDIVGSQISGCSGVVDAGGGSIGVQVDSVGATVRVLNDRVYGGARSGNGVFTVAVLASTAASLEVHNSMIHGGDVSGVGASANGVNIGAVAAPQIVYDTVYAGGNLGTAIVLSSAESGARITDDILLGGGTAPPRYSAIFAQSCGSSVVGTLDHTLFTNFGASLFTCQPGDDAAADVFATTIAGLETLLTPTVAAADLVYAQQTVCDDDAGCVLSTVCPSAVPATCLGSLFGAAWTADDGVSGLFQRTGPDGGVVGGGWALPLAGTPCAIAQGGIPVSGIPADIYGVLRSATAPTIGATELPVGSCSP